MSPRAVLVISLGLGAALAGCNAIFGVDDLVYRGTGGSSVTVTSSSSASTGGAGGTAGAGLGGLGGMGGGGMGGMGGGGEGGMGGSVMGICGDGELTPDETCDDSNSDPGDGCSDTCQIEWMPDDSCPPSGSFVLGNDPILIAGTTLGNDNGLTSMCADPLAPDAIFSFDAGASSMLAVSLEGPFSKAVSVRVMCTNAVFGACESNDPNQTAPLNTSIPLFLSSTVYVLVSGASAMEAGPFVLTVTP